MEGLKFIAPLSAALLLAGAQGAWANTEAHATVQVYVEVEPSITISPSAPAIHLGSVQTGVISGQVPFRVDSNGQLVQFRAATTPLFKGGVAGNSVLASVPPIPIRRESGIRINAEHANAAGGEDEVVDYVGPEGDVEGFPGLTTQSVEFESSQNNHFSQAVTLQVTWNQNDPEKPTGEYSGLVVLWAMVPPTDFPAASPPSTALASNR